MKSGRSLSDLAAELKRQAEAKRDYLAVSTAMSVWVDPEAGPKLALSGSGEYGIRKHAHGQMAEKLGIPGRYYERMVAEAPALWADNVNHWLTAGEDRRLVRTLDGHVRAFLSDRYRRLDYVDVAEVALPALLDNPDVQLQSCEVTETRLYLKATFPKMRREVRVGDVVEAGVVIGASEVGMGELYVLPMVHRLVCLNGAVANDSRWGKRHVGGRMMSGPDVALADDTLAAKDRALLMEMRDVIHAAQGEVFHRLVDRMQEAATGETVRRPVEAVKVLGKAVGLLQSEQESVLERLIRGGDYTRYGAMNAVTNLANDVQDYDRASELERAGGAVLDLSPSQWHEIALAA